MYNFTQQQNLLTQYTQRRTKRKRKQTKNSATAATNCVSQKKGRENNRAKQKSLSCLRTNIPSHCCSKNGWFRPNAHCVYPQFINMFCSQDFFFWILLLVLFSSLVLFSVCLNLLYITTRVFSFVCFICLLLLVSYPFFSIRGLNNLFCLSLFCCFLYDVNLFFLTSQERQTTMICGK